MTSGMNDPGTNLKQAACLSCRRSKIKCRREEDAAVCERCQNVGLECVIPEFHIGRQKGVKNKRSGLEKAIYQVEEAIKKRNLDSTSHKSTLQQLHMLLDDARSEDSTYRKSGLSSVEDPTSQIKAEEPIGPVNDDHLAIEGVENPLQLLAHASDLRITSPHDDATPETKFNGSEHSAFLDVHHFFLPMKANLDKGPGLDPVDVGLVTIDEADMLVRYYHERLAHTRWGLDPAVHTMDFVRSSSAFLFTTLLAMAAIFLPETASLAKRLLLHRRYLAEQVIVRKFRSVEIILAFMVSIPWMPPGSHASDDDTSLYLSTALSMSLDLSIEKIITPSPAFGEDVVQKISRADCLDAKRALIMDGFEDIDPQSDYGQKLLRRRERTWIALFVLDRGVCLARGRVYCAPKVSSILHCDQWHYHKDCDSQDGPMVSIAVLRRDLDNLFADVRSRCDSYHHGGNVGSKAAKDIDNAIDEFFDKWFQTWTSVIGDPESKTLPPYVEILVTHTRLSTYSMLLNHRSAAPEVKRCFRASALSSALNVMRTAVQGEARLQSMPNNSVTMICFSASIALSLSAPVTGQGGNKSLAPSVRNLIEETAAVLERIGSNPSHRNGASVLYGRFLRVLVRQATTIDRPMNATLQAPSPSMAIPDLLSPLPVDTGLPHVQMGHDHNQGYWPDPLQFSAMSYNEVNETITNSDLFASSLMDIPWNDNNLGWTDWMNLPDFNYL